MGEAGRGEPRSVPSRRWQNASEHGRPGVMIKSPYAGFSRQVRRGTGLSSTVTVTRPVPGDRPMDARPATHPTDQTLSSYGLGKLDDRAAEAVNEHLILCSAAGNVSRRCRPTASWVLHQVC